MIERQTKTFWLATFALACSSFFIFATLYYPQPLLPYFAEEFSISSTQAGLLISLPLLTLGVSFFIYSGITDAVGRKNVLLASLCVGLVATVLLIFSPGFWALLILRMLQAAALAAVPVAAMAYISEEFTTRALAVAVGIYISANSLGGMGGRLLSGISMELAGWQIAFVALGVLSIILLLVVARYLPAEQEFKPKPFRLKDVALDHVRHLKNSRLRSAYIIGGLHFFLFMGIFNYITFYLSGTPFYAGPALLGFLFLTYAAGTVSSTAAGKAAQWLSKPIVIISGIVMMAAALFVTLIPHLIAIILALSLLSFGFFFAHSSASAYVAEVAEGGKSSASALYLTSYYLCGGLGNFYYGWLWEQFQWTGVIAGSFAVLVLTGLITISLYITQKNVHKAQGTITTAS
ncbi:MFS transporter [Salsuginibacillus kocurii]|uniref:MFS transporter n=1 Tax=Salsuginibacillus kocurii TaxID=427078 RepID=UPI000366A7F8